MTTSIRVVRGLPWQVLVGGLLLLLLAVAGLVGPLVSPYGPAELTVGEPLSGPSLHHPFGLDTFGRDQLSRCLQGIQISLGLGVTVTALAFLLGTPLGLLTGYLGGLFDAAVSRALDIVFAFPSLLLALVLVAVLGPGILTAGIALVIIYIPIVARYVRGATIAERDREYVLAAKVSGTHLFRIARRHLLPNVSPAMVPLLTSVFSFAILAEAALSYLGVGAQPPLASLGKMLSDNQGMIGSANYLIILPCLTLSLLILSLTLLGDGLREAFDPRRLRRADSLPPPTTARPATTAQGAVGQPVTVQPVTVQPVTGQPGHQLPTAAQEVTR